MSTEEHHHLVRELAESKRREAILREKVASLKEAELAQVQLVVANDRIAELTEALKTTTKENQDMTRIKDSLITKVADLQSKLLLLQSSTTTPSTQTNNNRSSSPMTASMSHIPQLLPPPSPIQLTNKLRSASSAGLPPAPSTPPALPPNIMINYSSSSSTTTMMMMEDGCGSPKKKSGGVLGFLATIRPRKSHNGDISSSSSNSPSSPSPPTPIPLTPERKSHSERPTAITRDRRSSSVECPPSSPITSPVVPSPLITATTTTTTATDIAFNEKSVDVMMNGVQQMEEIVEAAIVRVKQLSEQPLIYDDPQVKVVVDEVLGYWRKLAQYPLPAEVMASYTPPQTGTPTTTTLGSSADTAKFALLVNKTDKLLWEITHKLAHLKSKLSAHSSSFKDDLLQLKSLSLFILPLKQY